MAGRLVFDIIIVAVIVRMTVCIPVQVQDNTDVEIRLLEEKWIPDHRVRRAADSNLPDHLTFSLPVKDKTAVLQMRRAKMLPVVMSDEDMTRAANRFSENGAVYTDESMSSAMIVKRHAQQYALEGSFVHNEVLWNLEHKNEEGNEGRIRHRIAPQSSVDIISYVGDDIVFTGDTKKENDTKAGEMQQNNTEQQVNQDNHDRVRRATDQHIVKVAFVVDFADYSTWIRYVGLKDAPKEMRLWYTYVAHSMNARFRTIKDPEVNIKVEVTVLKILDTAKQASFLTKITNEAGQFNGEKGLSAFLSWHKRQRDIPESHHFMLFTGLDISGISGIAYVGRLCTDEGLSIIQNSFDGNAGNTAAHELGHSLSARHDEDTSEGSNCTYENQFIMAPSFKKPVGVGNEGHPWRFSTCSIKAFKTFLKRSTCTNEDTLSKDVLAAGETELRPGEELSKDDQCGQYFLDSRSYFCQDTQKLERGMEQLCGGMYCSIPNSETFCKIIIPQEFTNCGQDKWCVTGECVDKFPNTLVARTTTTTTTTTTTAAVTRAPTVEIRVSSTSTNIHTTPTTTRSEQPNSGSPAVTQTNLERPLPTKSTRLTLENCYMYLLLGDKQAFSHCKLLLEYPPYPHNPHNPSYPHNPRNPQHQPYAHNPHLYYPVGVRV